jgi:octaprenyl-diphosphate synthase
LDARFQVDARVNDFRTLVQSEVDEVEQCLKHCCKASGVELIDDVWEHMLLSPGKRLRPTLLLLSTHAHGAPHPLPENAILAGAVVEMIHNATLIHDDVVDKATLRRGQPAVNHRWHDGVALMMGDFLYSKGFQLFTQAGLRREMAVLSAATNRMSVAEMMQFQYHHKLDLRQDDYLHLIQEKTASLIEASCQLGGLIAGVDNVDAIARYGNFVGMAFQITDDLFDYMGEEYVVGKPVGSDLREGKVTLPLIAALANATPQARAEMIRDIRSSAIFGGQWSRMIDFVQANGGVRDALSVARQYGDRAQEALENLAPSPERDALNEAVDFILNRCN